MKNPKDQLSKASLALRELRTRTETIAALRASLFPEQLAFIDDPSRLKAALCTRRAGKSYADGVYLVTEALKTPGCTCLYISATKEQAKRIMFRNVFKRLNKKFSLGLKFNHTTLEVIFPNGSVIYLMGMDSSPDEMDKAFGQFYKLVVIDEAAMFKQDQEKLVTEILEPATADQDGTIVMTGMPVNRTDTYFFQITYKPGSIPGWSVHRWSWAQNPHICVNMKKLVDRKILQNPRVVETAPFKRMYLGEWVVDLGARVYKFQEDRNKIDKLPDIPNGKYYYVVGLDLGFVDATAFVVAAYHPHDPNLYFVHAYKESGLDITSVATILKALERKYNPVKWIVDGASKQSVVEIQNRHSIPLEAADKVGKADIIEIMNADFTMGRIKMLPDASILQEEWEDLIWDYDKKKREEHPGYENHGCDAALYSWRYCFHYLSQEIVPGVKKGTVEEVEAWWEKEAMRGLGKLKEDPLISQFGEQYGFKH